MNNNLRVLAWAAYAVAFLLVAASAVDVLASILPFRLGEVQWRFGTAGIVANSLAVALLGVLVALATAAAMGHDTMARVVAVVSLVAATMGVLALAMFGLDALELRAQVRVETLPRFDAAAVGVGVKYTLAVITAVLLGVGGWKAASSRAADARNRTDKDSGVLLSSRDS